MRELAKNFVNDNALQSTKREMQRVLASRPFWLTTLAAAILLGLTGPFGTWSALSLPVRLAYWAFVGVVTYAAGYGLVTLLANLHGPGRAKHLAFWAGYGAIAGLPVALIVWALNAGLFGRAAAPALPELTAMVMAVSAVVSVIVALLERQTGAAASAQARPQPDAPVENLGTGTAPTSGGQTARAPESQPDGRPKILDRLPPEQRGRLSHMSMQDHYVDVRTDRGSTLVLMRFSDAIAETAGVDGLQIHRSHWVALAMAEGPARINGKPAVRMRDGSVLPVSRSYIDAARTAGLV